MKRLVLLTLALALTLIVVAAGTLLSTMPPRRTFVQTGATPQAGVPPTLSVEQKLAAMEAQIAALDQSTPLSILKDFAQILQSAITIVAIIVSGVWGYWLFVQNRQTKPRARLEHSVAHKPIADAKLLVHVTVTISNIGSILLRLLSLKAWIQQVVPPPAEITELIDQDTDPVEAGQTEIIQWPGLGKRITNFRKDECNIEPGESQQICFDFIIPHDIETIVVYSYLANEKEHDRNIGWEVTTLYDLRGGTPVLQTNKEPTMDNELKPGNHTEVSDSLAEKVRMEQKAQKREPTEKRRQRKELPITRREVPDSEPFSQPSYPSEKPIRKTPPSQRAPKPEPPDKEKPKSK